MAVTYNEAGIADVPIGGPTDIIRTGELFERSYDHSDSCGVPRDWTGLTAQSAVVYDPISLAVVANLVVDFGVDPTLGVLTLSLADADVPAAGQYRYRVRVTDGTNLRTLQEGRFTVGGAPA